MTDDAAFTTRSSPDGTVEEIGGKHVLRFERHLRHPIERVWAALTEPEQIAQWLAEAKLDLVEGGQVMLRWQNRISPEDASKYGIVTGGQEGPAVLHGTITKLEPPRLLEFAGDIHGVLRWELRQEGTGCVLTFTSTLPVLEKGMAAQVLAGWHWHLDALAAALAGHPIEWDNWSIDDWAGHRDRYAAKLA